MKPEVTEICYSVEAWGTLHKLKGWSYMGQRNTLQEAFQRRDELRKLFKRVRVIEHKRTATVVV